MNIQKLEKNQWSEIKEIYLEAFPKRERKPFFILKNSVKSGKAVIFTAVENGQVIGFVVAIPHLHMVMVDYLAVSGKIRSKGTGSYIMQEVCKHFADKKIVLLIEKLDDNAENREQRIARKRFYIKNGFTSTELFVEGKGGDMEVLTFGGNVSAQEYMSLQRHALGTILFKLSGMKIAE